MASSNGEEYSADFLNRFKTRPLTIVAVGKTGVGKSSTLNSILSMVQQTNKGVNPAYFTSNGGPNSCTEDVLSYEFEAKGLPKCLVVDTVGLFDTKLTQEEKEKFNFEKISYVDEEHRLVLKQFQKVMQVCKGGIDAFLFVLKGNDRATKEQLDTINIIFQYLGWNMLNYVIFIITGKDEATREAFEGWQEHVCNVLKSKGYTKEKIQDRFVFVDNKNPTEAQARDLLDMVRYVSDETRGNPYSLVAFETAQHLLEEEKKKIKKEFETQFRKKVDEELKPIEARHQQVMNNLQDRISKTEAEGKQLRADQVKEREKYDRDMAQLRREKEDEQRRFEAQTDRMINHLERQKTEGSDAAVTKMLTTFTESMMKMQQDHQKSQTEILNKFAEIEANRPTCCMQ